MRYLLLLLWMIGLHTHAHPRLTLVTTNLAYSEASAIYQMDQDWKDAPRQDGRQAFVRHRLEAQLQEDWLTISYIERNDWLLNFSPDTSWLVYQEQNDLRLPSH